MPPTRWQVAAFLLWISSGCHFIILLFLATVSNFFFSEVLCLSCATDEESLFSRQVHQQSVFQAMQSIMTHIIEEKVSQPLLEVILWNIVKEKKVLAFSFDLSERYWPVLLHFNVLICSQHELMHVIILLLKTFQHYELKLNQPIICLSIRK